MNVHFFSGIQSLFLFLFWLQRNPPHHFLSHTTQRDLQGLFGPSVKSEIQCLHLLRMREVRADVTTTNSGIYGSISFHFSKSKQADLPFARVCPSPQVSSPVRSSPKACRRVPWWGCVPGPQWQIHLLSHPHSLCLPLPFLLQHPLLHGKHQCSGAAQGLRSISHPPSNLRVVFRS